MALDEFKGTIKEALWRLSPAGFNAVVPAYRGQQFSIGIVRGDSPFSLQGLGQGVVPVLSHADIHDVPAAFVADPFMIRRNGEWHMFFEIFSRIGRRGQIGYARSDDGRQWQYRGTVLREPFHLAYPHVFEWAGAVYLVPDSPGQGIRLYRAERFPNVWRFVRSLREENIFSDSSLFLHDGLWWMLAGWKAAPGHPISLRLFMADTPDGAWREHPASPVVRNDDRTGRPCGRVLMLNGRVIRFAQDCSETYGASVSAYEIVELSQTAYQEQPLTPSPLLQAGPESWRSGGMHHVDCHPDAPGGWIACVDGWRMVGGH